MIRSSVVRPLRLARLAPVFAGAQCWWVLRRCTADGDCPDFSWMQPVGAVDSFAKPRVANYVARTAFASGGFVCRKSAAGWVRCEARVPIALDAAKPPQRVATAVGFARCERDAEAACAMHAERIIDAAGAELFSLATMQARHAVAAARDGRFARFPRGHAQRAQQDAVLAARAAAAALQTETVVEADPPPLVYGADAAAVLNSPAGGAARIGNINNVGSSHRAGPNTTRMPTSSSSSATIVDNADGVIEITLDDTKDTDDSENQHEGIEIDKAEHADWRVFPRVPARPRPVPSSLKHLDESEGGRYWLVEFGMYYHNEPHTLLSPHVFCADSLPRVAAWYRRRVPAPAPGFEDAAAATEIPFTAWGGQRVTLVRKAVALPGGAGVEAVGVAKDAARALQLCAMHAELLIDRLGMLLHDDDPATQRLHADACTCAGRWAAVSADEGTAGATGAELPKPLREWGDTSMPGKRTGRAVMHFMRPAPLTEEEFFLHCHHINVRSYHLIECNPLDLDVSLVEALRQFNIERGVRREAFYLNYDYGSMWRCTYLLPLDARVYGLRAGFAIGFTVVEAKLFAARHAVEVLCAFGIPLYSDAERQRAFELERKKRGLFVVNRDENGVAIDVPSPKSRSPPGYRSYGLPRPVPTYDEWRAAQMIDASAFTVVDVSNQNFETSLVAAFENYCANAAPEQGELVADRSATGGEARSSCNVMNYFGLQPVKGYFLVAANTVYASIPLPERGGVRTMFDGAATIYAVGRADVRKQAEKCFYVHALRIVDALDLLHLCAPRGTPAAEVDAVTRRVRECLAKMQVTTFASESGARMITWGYSREAMTLPLKPRDAAGQPVSNMNMRAVPPPCMCNLVAARCFQQTAGKRVREPYGRAPVGAELPTA